MSGKRNVTVCRGHELANALYMPLSVDGSTNHHNGIILGGGHYNHQIR